MPPTSLHVVWYAEGEAVGVADAPLTCRVTALSTFADGLYADGRRQAVGVDLRRRSCPMPTAAPAPPRERSAEDGTPRAAVGVAYAEGFPGYADGNMPSAYRASPVV